MCMRCTSSGDDGLEEGQPTSGGQPRGFFLGLDARPDQRSRVKEQKESLDQTASGGQLPWAEGWGHLLPSVSGPPGSAEEFEVRMCPEQLVVEHRESAVINCSTTCPRPDNGGVETSLNKTLLEEETQWKQYKVSGISQDTIVYCYFTCSGKQVWAPVNISVFYPPKEVLMTVQPIWVIMGESFIIECRVPEVAPLDKLTLTLLRGNESLLQQTFEETTGSPQEAKTTYNRTAHREDERYNFSCQAELDLRSRGGKIIRTTSESQGLKIHEPKQSKQMLIIIVVVSVLLSLFVTSVLLCFVFGQQWHQRRRGSYGVQAAWRRLRRAYRA